MTCSYQGRASSIRKAPHGRWSLGVCFGRGFPQWSHRGSVTPRTLSHFDEFFQLLPERGDSENSWSVPRSEIEDRNYDLKAVNPNRTAHIDARTPEELIATIEAKGREIVEALADLKRLL